MLLPTKPQKTKSAQVSSDPWCMSETENHKSPKSEKHLTSEISKTSPNIRKLLNLTFEKVQLHNASNLSDKTRV